MTFFVLADPPLIFPPRGTRIRPLRGWMKRVRFTEEQIIEAREVAVLLSRGCLRGVSEKEER
jgi:hypothetical protein